MDTKSITTKESQPNYIWSHIEFIIGIVGILLFTVLELTYPLKEAMLQDKFLAFMSLLVGLRGNKYYKDYLQPRNIETNNTDTTNNRGRAKPSGKG